jgi:PAS domain S-box-containing protein
VAVWTTDMELQLTSVAGSALDASGLRIDQIAGMGVFKDSHPDSAPLTAHRRALESGPQSYELETDGRTFESHVTALRNQDGGVLGCLGVAVDVTSHKETQGALEETAERLREADALKDLLLRAVSHDLKNPLGVVLGLADTIDQRFGELTAEEHKRLLRKVVGNAHRAVRIVSDLLDIDRMGRGVLEADRRPVDVGALIRELTGTVDQEDHPLATEISHAVAFVDPTYVRRIVDNLLVNAAAHTSAGTAIRLRVDTIESGVVISVDDEGPEMSAEELEAISTVLSGRIAVGPNAEQGIGLSLVRQFAELNGGRAWVEPRPEGGTSFHVFLPGGEGSPS